MTGLNEGSLLKLFIKSLNVVLMSLIGVGLGASVWLGCNVTNKDQNDAGLAGSAQPPLAIQVFCGEDSNCPEAVGLLLAKPNNATDLKVVPNLPDPFMRCTAFLIAPNIAVTSGHCLPSDLRLDLASCNDRIWFYLSGNEVAGCSQVLHVSKVDNKRGLKFPDYAFLLLDKNLNRKPLKFNHLGVSKNDWFQVWRAHSVTPHMVKIDSVRCQALAETVLTPDWTSSKSAVVALTSCPLIQGNSGSPVVDGTGAVRAVAFSSFANVKMKTFLTDTLDDFLSEPIANIAVAANLSCISTPLDPENWVSDYSECLDMFAEREYFLHSKVSSREEWGAISQDKSKNLKVSLQKIDFDFPAKDQFHHFVQAYDANFEWTKYYEKIAEKKSLVEVIPIPKCLKEEIAAFDLTYTSPLWELELKINANLEIVAKLLKEKSLAINLSYNHKKLTVKRFNKKDLIFLLEYCQ